MSRPDIEGLRALVEKMTVHARQPWRTEKDWSFEVYDAADLIVLKTYGFDVANGLCIIVNAVPALLDHIARLEAALGEAVDKRR